MLAREDSEDEKWLRDREVSSDKEAVACGTKNCRVWGIEGGRE